MKRMDYETLAMEEIIVEMENGFLSASVNAKTEVATTGQELIEIEGDVFDVEGDDANGWK